MRNEVGAETQRPTGQGTQQRPEQARGIGGSMEGVGREVVQGWVLWGEERSGSMETFSPGTPNRSAPSSVVRGDGIKTWGAGRQGVKWE